MKTQRLKALWLIILSLTAIALNSFSGMVNNGKQEIDLLRNEQHKEQAFDQILNNAPLFNELMSRTAAHPGAMNMMMEHRSLMETMMHEEYMGHMMEHHDEMHKRMMEGIMPMMEEHHEMREMMMEHMMHMMEEHPEMRENMMEMMHEHGHMRRHNDHQQ